ncbi:MAG TPA: hypothetical protein VGR62_24960 [Candidatus Binatia bacterium]|jgi:hypothetical protein|nr:hypothetical protein [Candidatus Binatia bacterium]
MALIDRRQRRWALFAAMGLILSIGFYVPYHRAAIDGPSGSSDIGLGFGIAAAALMLFEALLNVRKRFPTWAIGRAETWLKGHIWLGLLIVPLVLFHSGFRFRGTLAVTLTLVLAAVIASGIYGLVLQQFLPRMMTRWSPGETVYEQIPHVVHLLQLEAYEIAAAVCGHLPEAVAEENALTRVAADRKGVRRRSVPFRQFACVEGSEPIRRFYLEEVRPFLHGDGRHGPLAESDERRVRMVEAIGRTVPPALQEAVRDLGDVAAERRDLAVQRRLHHWLHGWLFVHVPLTAAMLVLLAAHVVLALRYAY